MIVLVRPPLAVATAITTATRPTTAWERAPAHNVVWPQQSSTTHWQQIKAIPSFGRPADTQTHQWCSPWIQRWMQTRWSRGWGLPCAALSTFSPPPPAGYIQSRKPRNVRQRQKKPLRWRVGNPPMITSLHTLITHTHKPFLLDLIRAFLNILGSLISLMWVNRDVTIQQTSNQPMHPPHITHYHTSHTTTHHTSPHITHYHTSHTTTHHTLPHITHTFHTHKRTDGPASVASPLACCCPFLPLQHLP